MILIHNRMHSIKMNPKRFKIIEIPITGNIIDFNFSDEAHEELGDQRYSPTDAIQIKGIKNEAHTLLHGSKKKNDDKDENEDENEIMNMC
jgi:hypothetical protein